MGAMKKLSLIVSHSDIVNIISELMYLECFEPIEPEVTLEPPELTDLVKRYVMDLDSHEANKESIVLLATQYTYTMVGWMPTQFEQELTSLLSGFTCSWIIEEPSPQESEDIPVFMKYSQVLGKIRSGGRKVFEPLAKNLTL